MATVMQPVPAIETSSPVQGARVPIYGIVGLGRGRLEIHSEPAGQAETAYYGLAKILGQDDEVALVLDGGESAAAPSARFCRER